MDHQAVSVVRAPRSAAAGTTSHPAGFAGDGSSQSPAHRTESGKLRVAEVGQGKGGCSHIELFVVAVVVKVAQERDQPVLVPPQDRFDLWRLFRVRDKDLCRDAHVDVKSRTPSEYSPRGGSAGYGRRRTHLEDVERLELDVLAPIFEQIHHDLEVLLVRDVPRHDLEVGPVEQDFAEQFQRLPLRDVVGRLDQERILREELCSFPEEAARVSNASDLQRAPRTALTRS